MTIRAGDNIVLDNVNFQTPNWCCQHMASLIPTNADSVLEPTKGAGNLVLAIQKAGFKVTAPDDFWDMDKDVRFDCVCMNPPFTPMAQGYQILYKCMEKADCIIALMPWLTIINSEKRTKLIMDFGLRSITHLPRNTFPGARVQCCILEMDTAYRHRGTTQFVVL
jgi:hypothetical protein